VVSLPGTEASSLQVNLPLGASDIRASAISVVLEWRTQGTACGIILAPAIAARSGRGRATTSGEDAGALRPADDTLILQAGSIPDESGFKPYLLTLLREGRSGPGEVVTLEFVRDPEPEGDTCDSDLIITAVRFSAGAELASDALRLNRDDRPRGRSALSDARTVALHPR
jgi:hypothetical protein